MSLGLKTECKISLKKLNLVKPLNSRRKLKLLRHGLNSVLWFIPKVGKLNLISLHFLWPVSIQGMKDLS